MPRNRVLSFMSQWGSPARDSSPPDAAERGPSSPHPATNHLRKAPPPPVDAAASQRLDADASASAHDTHDTPDSPTAMSRARGDSKPKRLSLMQTYNPPQVEVANDTPPELQPIFTYLNSHSNKLYQEGYFLKLHDLDSRGRPSADRVWTECFAQLIGTVLSLWDAAALDAAGQDAEVVPTFINLSDAAIKMIESLPMNGARAGSLQNVLSISTAANNRYLLHFNTLSSLTQWTAGIRLAMFEHATLQEAYTGSLIAGKGRYLNNIKQIMFRLKFAHEDWARVRFGAGTPWQRCWCVISPPDEKEWEKAQKAAKKAGPYEKVKYPKGDIKFYDTRKVTKKTRPIATVTDAYAAYAIYPQSKPLIEQSTLVKLEGLVTMHGAKESTTEGFVFVMPEVHQAVTGFEMMLRWLFPTFDAFGLYGRPQKLVADTLDQRGLMFAMPNNRRYGYLDILDVSGLIHTKGSQSWNARQWRRELKKLTSDRMMANREGMPRNSSQESRRRANTSTNRGAIRFGNGEVAHSTPGSRSSSPAGHEPEIENQPPSRTDSAPPDRSNTWSPHKRSTSEAQGYRRYMAERQARISQDGGWQDPPNAMPPPPPQNMAPTGRSYTPGQLERINSGAEVPTLSTVGVMHESAELPPHLSPVEPVGPPPAFTHQANSRPLTQPYAPPELRRANSNVDAATLAEMRDATSPQQYQAEEDVPWNGVVQQRQQQQPQNTVASQISPANRDLGVPADRSEGAVNRTQQHQYHDPRQRLITISGSPFVGGDSHSDGSANQAGPSQLNGTPSQPPPPPPPKDDTVAVASLHPSHSIARKPVPRASPAPAPTQQNEERPPVFHRSLTDPTNSPMGDSWEHIIINETAQGEELTSTERVNTLLTNTTESTEPDYASTVTSSPKKSVERPRAGKLRSVGGSTMQAINTEPEQTSGRSINETTNATGVPEVDFGRTYDYTNTMGSRSGGRPSTDTGEKAGRRRSRSADRLTELSREAGTNNLFNSAHSTPTESKRRSYFAPEPVAQETADSRSLAWQPAGTSRGPPVGATQLTPEQWVHQRALMARQQQYRAPGEPTPENVFHGRSSSVTNSQGRRKLTKDRPLSRNYSVPRAPSGDWSQASQIPSPPRPSSRGAGMNLDTVGRSLSATEQMQVSRATGSPLVNLSQTSNRLPEVVQPGLVNAVAQREREKAASRKGKSNLAVQHAIIERQNEQWRMQGQAQREYEMQVQMQQHQQQQMGWNQQYDRGVPYRPALSQAGSWQGEQQPQRAPQMGYGYPTSSQQYGYPGDSNQFEQQPTPPPVQRQAYGSSYAAQQQQEWRR